MAGVVGILLAATLVSAPLTAATASVHAAESFHPAEPARHPGAEPAGPEPAVREVLLDLRMGRLADQVVAAVELDGVVWLPALEFFAMAELRISRAEPGVIVAIRQPGNRVIEVHAEAARVLLDGRSVMGRPDAANLQNPGFLQSAGFLRDPTSGDPALLHKETVYVSTTALELLLDVSIVTDWTELSAVVVNPEHLPVGQRISRESRWNALARPGESRGQPSAAQAFGAGGDGRLGSFGAVGGFLGLGGFGGLALDWSVATSMGDIAGTTAGSVALGMQIAGGSLQVASRSIGPVGSGETFTTITYHRAWQDRRWLRQLTIGDAMSSGLTPRPMRGVHLTNAPYTRDHFFGVDSWEGRVSPDWALEIRQDGRTIDVLRADAEGRFDIEVPLYYGQNALEVIGFGPHGESLRSERLLRIHPDRLPAGAFEWAFSAGECRDTRCVLASNIDLRHGISNRLTVRGGIEGFTLSSFPDVMHPYLAVAAAPAAPLDLFLEVVHGARVRGSASLIPGHNFRIQASWTRFDRTNPDAVLERSGRRSSTDAQVFLRPVSGLPQWTIHLAGSREELTDRTLLRWQGYTGTQLRGTRIEAGLRSQGSPSHGFSPTHGLSPTHGFSPSHEFSSRTVRTWSASITTPLGTIPGLPTWNRPPLLRADLDLGTNFEAERVRGRLTHQWSRDTRFELAAEWSRTFGSHVGLAVHLEFDQLRSVTRWHSDLGGASDVVQFAQGGLQWSPDAGSVSFQSTSGVRQAGITGQVFLDQNQNGIRDPGEPVVPGVQVVVGGQVLITDADGRYLSRNLPAYTPTSVRIESASIPNPTWFPVVETVEILLPPSGSRRLDLALTPTGEVSGRVVRTVAGERDIPLPGIPLTLRPPDPDFPAYQVVTFSDGGFYAMGLRPGRYTVTVDQGALDDARLTQGNAPLAQSAEVVIEIGSGGGAHPPGGHIVRLVPREDGVTRHATPGPT